MKLLLFACFVSGALASCGAGRSCPSQEVMASIAASPTSLPCEGGWVTVTWKNVNYAKSTDWIGLYPAPSKSEDYEGGVLPWPIKFKRVSDIVNQTTQFQLIDRRVVYVVYYVGGNTQYPELKAKSNPVTLNCNNAPMRPHLAFAPSGGMYVMWQQGADTMNGVAKWQPSGSSKCGNKGSKEGLARAEARTFQRDDLCDRSLQPAARGGWLHPGFVLWAHIPGDTLCPGDKYELIVGDEALGFTTPMEFRAPLPIGPTQSVRLIAFGDMGTTSYGIDGALEFSWDFYDEGEVPSLNTSRRIKEVAESDGADLVVHFGDISYAVGFAAKWDQFLQLIQPVTKGLGLPWMTSMGNHEYGWSQSDWTPEKILDTATDSGGECGVPFITHFPYAQQTGPISNTVGTAGVLGKPPLASVCAGGSCQAWYSFKVGSIHFTMIDTEQDLKNGSIQMQWLRKDLEAVDRDVTPWLVVTGHRPIDNALSWTQGQEIERYLKSLLAPVLHEFHVDMYWSGHSHNYQRFAVDEQYGYKSFVIGTAGYWNSYVESPWPGLEYYNDTTYGFTHWTFENATHARGKFMSNEHGTLDDFHVVRPYPRAGRSVFV